MWSCGIYARDSSHLTTLPWELFQQAQWDQQPNSSSHLPSSLEWKNYSGGFSSQWTSTDLILHSSVLPVLPHQLSLFKMEPSRRAGGEYSSELSQWAWQPSGNTHFPQLPSTETMWQLVNISSFLPSQHWDAKDPYQIVFTAMQWH